LYSVNTDLVSLLVPALDVAAEMRALYLSPVNGEDRVLPHEAGDDVGTTRNGCQENVALKTV
jgi:hypothetical protein